MPLLHEHVKVIMNKTRLAFSFFLIGGLCPLASAAPEPVTAIASERDHSNSSTPASAPPSEATFSFSVTLRPLQAYGSKVSAVADAPQSGGPAILRSLSSAEANRKGAAVSSLPAALAYPRFKSGQTASGPTVPHVPQEFSLASAAIAVQAATTTQSSAPLPLTLTTTSNPVQQPIGTMDGSGSVAAVLDKRWTLQIDSGLSSERSKLGTEVAESGSNPQADAPESELASEDADFLTGPLSGLRFTYPMNEKVRVFTGLQYENLGRFDQSTKDVRPEPEFKSLHVVGGFGFSF